MLKILYNECIGLILQYTIGFSMAMLVLGTPVYQYVIASPTFINKLIGVDKREIKTYNDKVSKFLSQRSPRNMYKYYPHIGDELLTIDDNPYWVKFNTMCVWMDHTDRLNYIEKLTKIEYEYIYGTFSNQSVRVDMLSILSARLKIVKSFLNARQVIVSRLSIP